MQGLPRPEFPRLSWTGVTLLSFLVSACAADSPVAPDTTPVSKPAPPATPAPGPATPAATGPAIHLSAIEICFTTTDTRADARRDDVRITSADASPIDGLTATITYDAGAPREWLIYDFDSTSAPTRLWLRSYGGGMPPGTYKATVTVSSTTPRVAPVSIHVTLELRPLEHATLTITLATIGLGGAGNGRVTAPGIDCVLTNGVQGGDCEEAYVPGTVVQVRSVPASGQVFYYSHGCYAPGPCTDTGFDIHMNQDLEVVGGFGAPWSTLYVHRNGGGSGHTYVTGPGGIYCGLFPDGGGCEGRVEGGVGQIPLFAWGEEGDRFVRWEGACSGTQNECIVNFDTPGTVLNATAVFVTDPSNISLRLMGEGAGGTVMASAPAIRTGGGPLTCELANGVPGPCVGVIPEGPGTVTFTAYPAAGSVFVGWEVGTYAAPDQPFASCTGSSLTCTITVTRGASFIDGIATFAKSN